MRFNQLFLDTVKKQVVLKKVMSVEEWEEQQTAITFDYAKDNYFSQQKEIAILKERMSIMPMVDPYVGRYYSHEWVRKNILQQTDKEIKEIDKQTQEEMKDPLYQMNMGPDENSNEPPAPVVPTTKAPV
jgi:hypothetical protein